MADTPSTTSLDSPDYPGLVSEMQADLASLPDLLCPPSRSPSPDADKNIALWKKSLTGAVEIAGGDPTHPKWGHLTRMVKLQCTSRRYVGGALSVRVGEVEQTTVRVHESVGESSKPKKSKTAARPKRTPDKATKSSKYWPKPASVAHASPSKADIIRERVETWQANVVIGAAPEPAGVAPEAVPPPRLDKGKARAIAPTTPRVQTALSFSVKKRIGTKSKSSKTNSSSLNVVPPPILDGLPLALPPPPSWTPLMGSSDAQGTVTPPDDVLRTADEADPLRRSPNVAVAQEEDPAQMTRDAPGGASKSVKPPLSREYLRSNDAPTSSPHHAPDRPEAPSSSNPKISELSEMSFLPPSFPSQLQTSTPPPKTTRQKPATIEMVPRSPPPSSPLTRLSVGSMFDPTSGSHLTPATSSPSKVSASPARKGLKRTRAPSEAMDIDRSGPPLHSPCANHITKRPRMGDPIPLPELIPSSPVPIPPSTPPPVTSSLSAPFTPPSRVPGRAHDATPPPITPEPPALPTLTDLLASSRKSRPRPRPPSRKHTPQNTQTGMAPEEHDLDLPAVAEPDEEVASESPTKTYFSSPASGSSSGGSLRATSPVSPLFSQNIGSFAPAYMSTQRPDSRLGTGGGLLTRGGAGGSSGFFGLGYNSQFDVEGQIGQVSELLDRDVDYNGWLRDLDTVDEAEDPLLAEPSQEAMQVSF